MKIDERNTLVCVRWPPPAESFGHFIDQTIAMLGKLRSMHRIFRESLSLWTGTPETIPLTENLSNVRALMLEHAWDKKADPRCFSEVDDRGWPTEQSTSEIGFRARFGHSTPQVLGNMYLLFASVPDNPYAAGVASIKFPDSNFADFADFEDYDFVRVLFQAYVEHYDPGLCEVARQDVEREVEALSGKREVDEEIPAWMTYYSNAYVARALPAGESVEPFGPGGVLLTLQRRPPTPDDRLAIDHLVQLRLALKAGGYSMRQSLIRSAR